MLCSRLVIIIAVFLPLIVSIEQVFVVGVEPRRCRISSWLIGWRLSLDAAIAAHRRSVDVSSPTTIWHLKYEIQNAFRLDDSKLPFHSLAVRKSHFPSASMRVRDHQNPVNPATSHEASSAEATDDSELGHLKTSTPSPKKIQLFLGRVMRSSCRSAEVSVGAEGVQTTE